MLTKVHCESEKSLLYIISTHCDFGCTRSPHFLRGSCPPFSTIFVVSSKNQLKLFSLLLGSCQSRNVLKEHSYVDKKGKKKFALSLRVFGTCSINLDDELKTSSMFDQGGEFYSQIREQMSCPEIL